MGEHTAVRPEAVPEETLAEPRPPLLLAGMSVLAPGSGHFYAGYRRTGLAILSVFVATVLAAAMAAVSSRDALARAAVRPAYLTALVVAAVVFALGMVAVVVTAYLLGRPGRLERRQRALAHGVVGLLCLAVVAPPALVTNYALVQRGLISDVFPTGDDPPAATDPWAGQGRLNLLLIGGDGDRTREGIRADSITVASIDTHNGDTIMFSLPRNLQGARFLDGSPAAEAMPDGYPDFVFGVHRFGAEHPQLFPETDDPGSAAVSSVAAEALGLPIHYYVLANMQGFSRMVDAIGGVRIRVEDPIPIGGISASGGPAPIEGYVEPGLRTLDGFEALWYARSRTNSDDYDRMDRQRCLLGGLARQSDPITVLRNFEALASATKDAVTTNIPQKRLPDFVDLARKVSTAPITSVQFVPPEFHSANPDFDRMRTLVRETLAAEPDAEPVAGGGPAGSPPAGGGTALSAVTRTSPTPTPTSSRADAGDSVDELCRYE